ncbi:hypothetical protein [Vibrio metschnikovii]|uniref:hypothetical protein n=1 Tax=Vibrio metschnikovii TaxID=28172 RepID=UPI001C30429A|nr:hypothetical protein [Vibrio metschnikovii]
MTVLGILDGLGSKSNLIYWGRVLDNIETQIESTKEYEKDLENALYYPLWLLACSEYVFSLLRRRLAIKQDQEKILDAKYSELVKKSKEHISSDAHECIEKFEIIRNTLVHKGFPNTFSVPMKNRKDGLCYESIQKLMREPKFYFCVKSMKKVIQSEIG